MYNLLLTTTAKKQLHKLPRKLQQRISAALDRLYVRPHKHLKRLIGTPYHRYRVGDYRIIIRIEEEKLLILVLEIDHRKRVYKNI